MSDQSLSSRSEWQVLRDTCPSCKMPFDRLRKRRLLDSCGHERCFSCFNKTAHCPLCKQTGSSPPKMSRNLSCTSSTYPTEEEEEGASSSLLQLSASSHIFTREKLWEGSSHLATHDVSLSSSGGGGVVGCAASGPNTTGSASEPETDYGNTSKESGFYSSDQGYKSGHFFTPSLSRKLVKSGSRVSFGRKSSTKNETHQQAAGASSGSSSTPTFARNDALLASWPQSVGGSAPGTPIMSSLLARRASKQMVRQSQPTIDEHPGRSGAFGFSGISSRSPFRRSLREPMATAGCGWLRPSVQQQQQPGGGLSSSTSATDCWRLFQSNSGGGPPSLASDDLSSGHYKPAYRSLERKKTDYDSSVSKYSAISKSLPKKGSSRLVFTVLKPLYFEVPTSFPVNQFTGREWLFREIIEQFTSNLPTNRGVLITGGPGSGKTATILAIVEQSCFGQIQQSSLTGIARSKSTNSVTSKEPTSGFQTGLHSLAKSVVAYHFCQAENATTCHVSDFIHSMAAQMSQSPQLTAFYHLIQRDDEVRSLLSLSNCMARPSQSLVEGVLEPLKMLKKNGKISGEICTIIIDGLCEAEQHRPDFGDSLATFLAKHLLKFPSWLKVVCTVRSQITDITRLMPFFRISLDHNESDARINKDMHTFITKRISSSKHIQGNLKHKSHDNDHINKFTNFLVNRSKGCFLYTKLILDLIERGQLVIKADSYKVIPRSLSEIYMLILNIRFSTNLAYERVADIFSICLASLQSKTLAEVYRIHSALSLHAQVSWREFRTRYNSISDLLVTRSDGSMMFFHPNFRDWLVKRRDGDAAKFLCDVRTGHAAVAFSITRSSTIMKPEKVLELVHHVLKASFYKNRENSENLHCRDIQAALISLSADDISATLGCPKNIYLPVLKVSRMLMLSGATPDFITQEYDHCPLVGVYSLLGNRDMVSLLLEYSADTNAANNRGECALYFASREGHLGIVELLLDCGAQVNRVTHDGVSSVVAASRNGHLEVVEHLLLCEDWNSDTTCSVGPSRQESALQGLVAAAYNGHYQIVDYLCDYPGLELNLEDSLTGLTPLCAAASSVGGSTLVRKTLDILVKRKVSCEKFSSEGLAPIHHAARSGSWEAVDFLLKEFPGILDQPDIQGRTPAIIAAIGGHQGLLELLVGRSNSSVHTKDKDGRTPLQHAVQHGHDQVVKFLIDSGADVTVQDEKGMTSLDIAVEVGNEIVVDLLLDAGADMDRPTHHLEAHDGIKPVDRAVALGLSEVVSCFLRKGAKLSSSTWQMAEDKPEIQILLINKILEDGNTLFRKNQIEDAAHRYRYALRRIPTIEIELAETFSKLETHLLLNLSRCERRLGHFSEAEQLACQVLEHDPKNVEAMIGRAKACKAAGRTTEAFQHLSSASEIVPGSREIRKALAKLREELEPDRQLVKISPFLGSVQSIPYMDDSSCRSSSIAS